ncbi:hypothetical protein CHUAL_000228 [Chamberlinius hualienensis]
MGLQDRIISTLTTITIIGLITTTVHHCWKFLDQYNGHCRLRTPPRIVVVGLEGSGKTTILRKIRQKEEHRNIKSTEGYNLFAFCFGGKVFNIWEVGGKFKSKWLHFLENADLMVFVVDSSENPEQLKEAVIEFNMLIANKCMENKPVLVLANKQDCDGVKSPAEIESLFGYKDYKIGDHDARCLGIKAISNETEDLTQIKEAFESMRWLSSDNVRKNLVRCTPFNIFKWSRK